MELDRELRRARMWEKQSALPAWIAKLTPELAKFRADVMGTARAFPGKVQRAYRTTLPTEEWLGSASLGERIAERAGFLALPAAVPLYLSRRRNPQAYPRDGSAGDDMKYVTNV